MKNFKSNNLYLYVKIIQTKLRNSYKNLLNYNFQFKQK